MPFVTSEKYELDLLHASLLTDFQLGSGKLTNNLSFTVLDQFDREDVTERESSGPTATELTPFDENGLIIAPVDAPPFTNTGFTQANFYPEFIDRTGQLNKFVEELRAAKKRGDKMKKAAEHQAWENRKTQIVIDKKES